VGRYDESSEDEAENNEEAAKKSNKEENKGNKEEFIEDYQFKYEDEVDPFINEKTREIKVLKENISKEMVHPKKSSMGAQLAHATEELMAKKKELTRIKVEKMQNNALNGITGNVCKAFHNVLNHIDIVSVDEERLPIGGLSMDQTHMLEAPFIKARDMSDYDDDRDQKTKKTTTPVRSFLHLIWMQANKTIHMHPWAAFLMWFWKKYTPKYGANEMEKIIATSFNSMQRMDTPLYSVQFIYKIKRRNFFVPYVSVTTTNDGCTSRFFIYDGEYAVIKPEPTIEDLLKDPPKPVFKTQKKQPEIQLYKFIEKIEAEDSQKKKRDGNSRGMALFNARERRHQFLNSTIIYDDAEGKDDREFMLDNGMLCMPIISENHIKSLGEHEFEFTYPWGDLISMLKDVEGINSVFSPLQRIDTPKFSIQLVYKTDELNAIPYVIFSTKGQEWIDVFFIHGEGCIMNTEFHIHKKIADLQSAEDELQRLRAANNDGGLQAKKRRRKLLHQEETASLPLLLLDRQTKVEQEISNTKLSLEADYAWDHFKSLSIDTQEYTNNIAVIRETYTSNAERSESEQELIIARVKAFDCG